MRARLRTPEQERAAYTYLTVADVAERLHCTTAHVRHLITGAEKGERLPAINIGAGKKAAEYRVSKEALDKWIETRAVKGDGADAGAEADAA